MLCLIHYLHVIFAIVKRYFLGEISAFDTDHLISLKHLKITMNPSVFMMCGGRGDKKGKFWDSWILGKKTHILSRKNMVALEEHDYIAKLSLLS